MVKKTLKKKVVKKAPAKKAAPERDEEETEETTPRRRRRTAGTGRKRSQRLKTPVKLTQELRGAAGHALAEFEEKLMEYETVGFTGASTRELNRTINGKKVHVGWRKAVKFEVGDGESESSERRQAIITVQFR